MKEIKFTISGLRGIWGENLNETLVKEYIHAFALYLQKRNAKKIILGRDARISGPIINTIVKEILTEAGIDIIDIGIAPTPTVIFLVKHLGLDGGIVLSASHNPPEYNGVKFLSKRGMYITQEEVDELKEYKGQTSDEKEIVGIYTEDDSLGELHVEHILEHVDVDLIRSKKFTVVLDPINSAGYKLGPLLLEKLGCTVHTINSIPDGQFAHMPEPLPENLEQLGHEVLKQKADIGFAMDPDADRLVLCDEQGSVIFEEYTLSLAIKAVLKKTPGHIATNLSTSNTNEDLVSELGFTNFRTKVGEAHVVDGIVKHQAVIGGEGGGGVIHPKINLCRDSLTGIALILESLAQENKPVSKIVEALPKYIFIKEKIPFTGNIVDVIAKITALFPNQRIDIQDGLRIDFADRSWIQLRASNTEPIIRIFGEAKKRSIVDSHIVKIKNAL